MTRMVAPMRLVILFLLLAGVAIARPLAPGEPFPGLTFIDIQGRTHPVARDSEKLTLVVVSERGRRARKRNEAWLKALLKEFGSDSSVRIWLVADFKGLPGFIDKDNLRAKMLETAETAEDRAVLEHMLFDWTGTTRNQLALNSQIYVFLVSPDGKVLNRVIGDLTEQRIQAVRAAMAR